MGSACLREANGALDVVWCFGDGLGRTHVIAR